MRSDGTCAPTTTPPPALEFYACSVVLKRVEEQSAFRISFCGERRGEEGRRRGQERTGMSRRKDLRGIEQIQGETLTCLSQTGDGFLLEFGLRLFKGTPVVMGTQRNTNKWQEKITRCY